MWSLMACRDPAGVERRARWQAVEERTWRRLAADFIPVVTVVLLYFLARGLAPDRPAFAVRLAWQLVQFEEVIGVLQEERLQDAFVEQRWVRETANIIYAYEHFPALVGMALALWLRERRRFFLVRNAMYVSMAIGLVCYYALPTAPPRLLAAYGRDVGFIDTVHGGDTFVRYDQPWFFVNDFAAMPSYHFGWMLLTSMAPLAAVASVRGADDAARRTGHHGVGQRGHSQPLLRGHGRRRGCGWSVVVASGAAHSRPALVMGGPVVEKELARDLTASLELRDIQRALRDRPAAVATFAGGARSKEHPP